MKNRKSNRVKFIGKIVVLLFLISCNNQNESEIIDINNDYKIENLTGRTIQVPVVLLAPSAMTIIENKLIILDKVNEGLFKVFNLPGIEYSYSWGDIGKGPAEFSFIDNNTFNSFADTLIVYDNTTIKYLSVNDDKLLLFKSIKLPIYSNPINHLQRLNDSIFVADNFFEEPQEHILINILNKKIINGFGNYPDDKLSIEKPLERYQIYSKSVISNPDGNLFAVFYYNFPRIKIYNKTELEHNIKLNISGIRDFSVETRDKNLIHFFSPYSTAKHIYILWLNLTELELEKKISSFKPELFVWDWNGKLIKRYKLDLPVTSFAVSEKHKKIYCTNLLNEDEIFVYDLPF